MNPLPPAQNPSAFGAHARPWLIAALLVAVYLALRLPNRRDQPVFCDEATYLRWAQLIAADPLHNAFISMEDAKPPLHYWLLAATRWLDADPVIAGRLLSVICGALTIPALLALCRELGRFIAVPPRDRVATSWALLAALFFIACPLVAMNQRMALAEPLLLLEAVVLGWLSLRLARRISENLARRALLVDGLLLGLTWAATLLTKQNFSYLLWVLPPAALAASMTRPSWRAHARAFLGPYALATVIGLACFIPVLFTSDAYDLRTRLFYKPMFTQTSLPIGRATMLMQNLAETASPRGPLALYVTLPVLVLALGATLWMLQRRMWRPLVFLGVWCAALLGSLVASANITYSRYLLLGSVPLLIAAAWMAAELLATRRFAWRVAALATIVATLAWPAWTIVAATRDFSTATLTKADREQYVNGPGNLVVQAIAWLKAQAAIRPITVVTGNGLGLQNDLTWLMLRHAPNIQLLADDKLPPLKNAARGTVQVSAEQWRRERVAIQLSAERPIYYLSVGVSRGVSSAVQFIPSRETLGADTRLAAEIPTPPAHPSSPVTHAIAIFQLAPPNAQASANPK